MRLLCPTAAQAFESSSICGFWRSSKLQNKCGIPSGNPFSPFQRKETIKFPSFFRTKHECLSNNTNNYHANKMIIDLTTYYTMISFFIFPSEQLEESNQPSILV